MNNTGSTFGDLSVEILNALVGNIGRTAELDNGDARGHDSNRRPGGFIRRPRNRQNRGRRDLETDDK